MFFCLVFYLAPPDLDLDLDLDSRAETRPANSFEYVPRQALMHIGRHGRSRSSDYHRVGDTSAMGRISLHLARGDCVILEGQEGRQATTVPLSAWQNICPC